MRRGECGRGVAWRGEARRNDGRKEKQKNGLNEMRHSLFSEYYKVCRGRETRRWNNKGPSYALGALFIAAHSTGITLSSALPVGLFPHASPEEMVTANFVKGERKSSVASRAHACARQKFISSTINNDTQNETTPVFVVRREEKRNRILAPL